MPKSQPLPAATVSLIRNLLHDKKTRDHERAFVLEGIKPVRELLQTRAPELCLVVATDVCLEKHPELLREWRRGAAPLYTCREAVFDKLSDLRTAAGLLAVVRQPVWNQETMFRRESLFGLYGECLQDPANVGTILRTALAFNLDALWLSSDSADVFNPKVVRASAGAVLKLPVFTIAGAEALTRRAGELWAAEPPRKTTVQITELTTLPRRVILAVGNESRGLSESVLKRAAVRFHIPLNRAVESLNVAASVAIAAFYLSALPRAGGRRESRG